MSAVPTAQAVTCRPTAKCRQQVTVHDDASNERTQGAKRLFCAAFLGSIAF